MVMMVGIRLSIWTKTIFQELGDGEHGDMNGSTREAFEKKWPCGMVVLAKMMEIKQSNYR